jgi:hypothetical protein
VTASAPFFDLQSRLHAQFHLSFVCVCSSLPLHLLQVDVRLILFPFLSSKQQQPQSSSSSPSQQQQQPVTRFHYSLYSVSDAIVRVAARVCYGQKPK